ncbi:MAG: EamA family transporter [Pseudomonadales bacterium]
MGEELWIPITVAAAFLQNLRSLLQKRLTGALSVNGAAYVRFCYALPFAWLYLLALGRGSTLPSPTPEFWAYCLTGALGQVFANACLVAAFTVRNFAVATALSKTEAVQTALIGFVVLADAVSTRAAAGIGVSLIGVLALSGTPRVRDLLRADRALVLGLLAGAGLAVAAVGFRGAALALPSGSALVRAATVLTTALTVQTLLVGVSLMFREPGQLARVARAWRGALWVGVCGMLASAGWFTAMTLQSAALVRALGQVELVFAVATSVWLFRERLTWREGLGVALLVIGILLLL